MISERISGDIPPKMKTLNIAYQHLNAPETFLLKIHVHSMLHQRPAAASHIKPLARQ